MNSFVSSATTHTPKHVGARTLPARRQPPRRNLISLDIASGTGKRIGKELRITEKISLPLQRRVGVSKGAVAGADLGIAAL
jgi:hypothetical protein